VLSALALRLRTELVDADLMETDDPERVSGVRVRVEANPQSDELLTAAEQAALSLGDYVWTPVVPLPEEYDATNPVLVFLTLHFAAPIVTKLTLVFDVITPTDVATLAAIADTGLIMLRRDDASGKDLPLRVPWDDLSAVLNELIRKNYIDLSRED
jgi:hypothetical protein